MVISVERVRRAYEVSGIRPMNGAFVRTVDGECFGCALTALAIAERGCTWQQCTNAEVDFFDLDGLDDTLVSAFIRGFDNGYVFHDMDENEQEYFDIGAACRYEMLDEIEEAKRLYHAMLERDDFGDCDDDDDDDEDFFRDEDDDIWNDPNEH